MHYPCSITTGVIQTDSDAFTGISNTVRDRTVFPWFNTCTEIGINDETTMHIGSKYIELAGKRFDTKQLAYLLSKLLDEHPECQV